MGVTKPKDNYKEKDKEKEEKKKLAKSIRKEEKTINIIRVAGTDLNGELPLFMSLPKIRGIGYTTSKIICKIANVDRKVKLSDLKEQEIEKLEKIIKNPPKFGVPFFILNRRKDRETGEDMHLSGSDLDIAKKFDVQRYIDLRTYKGWRHMMGQPVRGQRTRSTFRGKGKMVGVIKKSLQQPGAKPKPAEKEEKK